MVPLAGSPSYEVMAFNGVEVTPAGAVLPGHGVALLAD
jgi:hypothetical protein